VTKTASFDTVAVAGGAGDMGGNFSPGGLGMSAAIVVDVSAIDYTTGDESYSLKMQESSDNATWTDCGPALAVLGSVGPKVVVVRGHLLKQYVRLDGVLGGTTPSITLQAWLNTAIQR
jgi:hypothetical protein